MLFPAGMTGRLKEQSIWFPSPFAVARTLFDEIALLGFVQVALEQLVGLKSPVLAAIAGVTGKAASPNMTIISAEMNLDSN